MDQVAIIATHMDTSVKVVRRKLQLIKTFQPFLIMIISTTTEALQSMSRNMDWTYGQQDPGNNGDQY